MSAESLTPVTEAGQAFVQAIETAGAAPLHAHDHLELLDEITEWLARAHGAFDVVLELYSTLADDRAAGGYLN